MSFKPIVVYLDTQDYGHIFKERGEGPATEVLNKILEYRDQDKVVIGFSWATMLEFITKPTEKFRTERVRRGQLVKRICGRNAFPYLTDLSGNARFPNGGVWMPLNRTKLISAKSVRKKVDVAYDQALAGAKNMNRSQKRRLKAPSVKRQFFREHGTTWGTKREDFPNLPVSNELLESGVINRFVRGMCSDSEFEERMNLWLSDPEEYSRIVYDYADKPNLMDAFLGEHVARVEDAVNKLRAAIRGVELVNAEQAKRRKDLIDKGVNRRTAKSLAPSIELSDFDLEDLIIKLEKDIGVGRAHHIGHYVNAVAFRENKFDSSDLFDILQMCYVSDCDLFRCDKRMEHIYRDYAPFSGKLVKHFRDLPERIESLISKRDLS